MNRKELATYSLGLPSVKEQSEIEDTVLALDGRVIAESSTLNGLRKLKKTLMSVLLTGEVRVISNEEAA